MTVKILLCYWLDYHSRGDTCQIPIEEKRMFFAHYHERRHDAQHCRQAHLHRLVNDCRHTRHSIKIVKSVGVYIMQSREMIMHSIEEKIHASESE